MTDDRVTALPTTATTRSDAEWHVIHAGLEAGPFSLAELVGKAAIGEIEADDLVKRSGGRWIKARDVDFLQQQFLLTKSREETGQRSSTQASQKAEGTVNHAALVMFTIGTVLFLLGHVDAGPLAFLLTCFVWGMFFGVPAYLCFQNKKQTGMRIVAEVFLFAAGLDVAVLFYKRSLVDDLSDRQVTPPPVRKNTGRLPAEDTGTELDFLPLEDRPVFEGTREERQRQAQEYIKQSQEYWKNQALQKAKENLANGQESIRSRLVRRALPLASALLGFPQAREYKDAKHRFLHGLPEAHDYKTIAGYERTQHLDE